MSCLSGESGADEWSKRGGRGVMNSPNEEGGVLYWFLKKGGSFHDWSQGKEGVLKVVQKVMAQELCGPSFA